MDMTNVWIFVAVSVTLSGFCVLFYSIAATEDYTGMVDKRFMALEQQSIDIACRNQSAIEAFVQEFNALSYADLDKSAGAIGGSPVAPYVTLESLRQAALDNPKIAKLYQPISYLLETSVGRCKTLPVVFFCDSEQVKMRHCFEVVLNG